MKSETLERQKLVEKFEGRLLSIKRELQLAVSSGLLYAYVQERSNTECERCGKRDVRQVVLCVCKDQDQLQNDPLAGNVHLLGVDCYKKLGMKVKLQA